MSRFAFSACSIVLLAAGSCVTDRGGPTRPGAAPLVSGTRPTTTKLIDAGGPAPAEPPAGVAVYVGDELLRDYRPRSTLVTPAHRIDKPKFPVLDVHCHWTLDQDPQFMLRKMDELGVTHAVNLSGGHGETLWRHLEKFAAPSDGRLIIFANLDFSMIDAPDFGAKTVAFLEAAHRRGARGLKVFKNLGLVVRDRTGALVSVDDARLDPVCAACGLFGMPVLIHAGDPVAFFQPVDASNERWMQLKRHPDWSFHGPEFPAWRTVIEQRNRVIARHPDTTFIIAHMAEAAHDYATLARWLDDHPNMHVDLSGRDNEIGRQPRASRAFFERYADRILFGTDRYPGRGDQPRYNLYYRMLETSDEAFDYFDNSFPPAGEWKIYGLGLADATLRKVYGENARRLLKLPAATPSPR